jgi:hypothetical protein
MCYEHISKNAQYLLNGEKGQRFEKIDWFEKLGPIEIRISDQYFLKYKKAAGPEEFEYLPSENSDLQMRDAEDKLAKTISVRLEDDRVLAAWNSSAGKAPLAYQVILSKSVLNIFIKNEDIMPTGAEADGGANLGHGDTAPGGVDFRQLPVAGQPAVTPVFMPQMQQLAANSQIKDLDQEWGRIRADMLAPEMPYNRIKEYIAVCLSRPDCRNKLGQAVSCLIDILRMEEDQALATNQELKDILMCLS